MKTNVKIIVLILVLGMINFICTNSKVYADPNSSKGFAEYDDTQAEKENQKMLEEQEKEVKATAGKSTNNYLESLTVEGYELSPKFDKQTVEYTLNTNITNNEINVIAIPSDTNATVKGAGKIKLQNGTNEIRIDVVAASGTVRTYIIHITGQINSSEQTQEPTETPEQDEKIEEKTNTIQGEETKNEENALATESINKDWIIYIIALVLAFTILVVIAAEKSQKGKH